MAGCCNPRGFERVFDRGCARESAQAYRNKGLDGTARRMVDFLKGRGIAGCTVLEVGGGVGALQIELLRAGAARAVNVELSPAYEEAALALLEESGLVARVERHVLDFARAPGAIAPADIVVLHRVVCCYPDMERLVGAAAERARRHLAMSFPRDSWWARLGIRAENLWHWLRRTGFRVYHHPAAAIRAVAESYGFRIALAHRGRIWETMVLEKVRIG
jgi:magnesium-protoporphyrin O-methyltransferase